MAGGPLTKNKTDVQSKTDSSASIQSLIASFTKVLEKQNINVNMDISRIATGIPLFDVVTGGGLPSGGLALFTGASGCGKTLLALSMIRNILKEQKDSVCVVIDAETTLTIHRLKQLGIDPDRVMLLSHVTVESVLFVIEEFMKMKHEQGITSPSIILWDSIAATPVEKESLTNRVEETMALKARILSSKLPIVCQNLSKYNTCLIAINQLRDDIVINPYDRSESTVRGLDGNLPGGKAQYYQASLLVRVKFSGNFTTMDVDHTKATHQQFKPSDDDFIGYKISLDFVKNKFALRRPISLITDFRYGVSDIWTRFNYLTETGHISAAGGWQMLKSVDKKFRRKELENLLKTDPKFKEVFDSTFNNAITEFKQHIDSITFTSEMIDENQSLVGKDMAEDNIPPVEDTNTDQHDAEREEEHKDNPMM